MRKKAVFVIALVILVAAFIFLRRRAPSRATDSSPIDDPILYIDTPDKGYLSYPVRILGRSTMEALTFDPKQGKPATISYKLTRDGDIRIRITWRQQKDLVLRTLLDWTGQEFGPHEVQWDGRDASGNFVDNTRCFIDFQGDSREHKEHEPGKCHELDLKVLSPTGTGVVIRQLSEVRLELVGDRAYGKEDGYELRTYVDYQLVAKASLGKDVTVFSLPDVENLSSGSHLITVNVEDRHDHVGVAGIQVYVQR